MRKWFSLAAILVAVLAGAPADASTDAKSGVEAQQVLKKKKLAALKAEARMQADLLRKLQDRKKAALAAAKQNAEKRVEGHPRCRGFLNCLFGRPGARLTKSKGSLVPDHATAEVVKWRESDQYAQGSIVVRTPERALYYVLGDGKARRYSVGVGREGFQWSGNSSISAKQEWPRWNPPEQMIEREAAKGHFIPDHMEGGPENPLGARAMYIGGTLFRIHGTNNAASIGGAVSSGCIRMMNTDVIDLYRLVKVGAPVHVIQ